MFPAQFKMRLAVVEMGRFPVFFFVTVLAFGPQPTFVLIVLFMATDALYRCLPVLLLWIVTIPAKNAALQMAAPQNKTGNGVIEIDRIQLRNARAPSFMFGVTLFAFFYFLHQAMIAPLFGYILCDLLVTVFAESGLRRLVVWLVAFIALALVLGVPLDHLARHQQLTDRIGACLRGTRKNNTRIHKRFDGDVHGGHEGFSICEQRLRARSN
jgi:hypothetical protein